MITRRIRYKRRRRCEERDREYPVSGLLAGRLIETSGDGRIAMKCLGRPLRLPAEVLVEAAGVEPASEIAVSRENPCSVRFRMFSPHTLRTDKMRIKLVR